VQDFADPPKHGLNSLLFGLGLANQQLFEAGALLIETLDTEEIFAVFFAAGTRVARVMIAFLRERGQNRGRFSQLRFRALNVILNQGTLSLLMLFHLGSDGGQGHIGQLG
jgi:hypothetical protein